MSKRQELKYKIDRRLGVNLWGRPKSPINKREYGPGQHGQRRKKPSEYGLQLTAKQRLKGYYGNIGERQFRRIYDEAMRRRGDSGENLVALLERRLDTVVYRAKFAPTVFASRQLVNHGHVKVNGRRVNIGSYQRQGQRRDRGEGEVAGDGADPGSDPVAERDVPDYINVDHKLLKATFLRSPKLADVPYPVQMEPNRVIEYYSH